MKFALIVFVCIAALIVAVWGLAIYLSPNDLAKCSTTPDDSHQNCQKADVIVAISGGDTKARTSEAIDLYQRGWADQLVFSGAALDARSPSNALTMKRLAIEAGVPAANIQIEETGRDTSENALATRELFKNNPPKRLILVTSPYHQRRASILFKQAFGPGTTIVNHSSTVDSQWSRYWWLTPNGWWLAMSELFKILFTSFGKF